MYITQVESTELGYRKPPVRCKKKRRYVHVHQKMKTGRGREKGERPEFYAVSYSWN